MRESFINSDGEIQKSPVEYLVLSGGGAKGVLYSGVYEAMEASGTRESMKGVAGSSAGAISAALIATGMDAKDFTKLTSTIDIASLLGKGIGPILKDGKPLYELLDKTIRENITGFIQAADTRTLARGRIDAVRLEKEQSEAELSAKKIELQNVAEELMSFQQRMQNDPAESKKRENIKLLRALQNRASELNNTVGTIPNQIKGLSENIITLESIASGQNTEIVDLHDKCIKGEKIIFKDLGLMHLLEPKKFKDLHVTAVSKKTGDLRIFNAKDSPNVEIALACKASASIPIVVKSVQIDGQKYVDGGYKDNTPYRAFLQTKKKSAENAASIENITGDKTKLAEARAQGKTLAFVFENDPAKVAAYSSAEKIYEPGKLKQFLLNVVVKTLARVGGKWKYTDTEKDTYNQIRDNASSTILLNPKKVGTLDFKQAKKKQEYLHATGYIQTMEHFDAFKPGHKKDPNLALKSCMLQIYDDIEKTQSRKFWQAKVSGANAIKNNMLDFCMSDKWKSDSAVDIAKQYVIQAATVPGNPDLSEKTPSMHSILKILNHKTTPDDVKQVFSEAIHGAYKMQPEHVKFTTKITRFSEADVKHFISQNKDLVPAQKTQTHQRA